MSKNNILFGLLHVQINAETTQWLKYRILPMQTFNNRCILILFKKLHRFTAVLPMHSHLACACPCIDAYRLIFPSLVCVCALHYSQSCTLYQFKYLWSGQQTVLLDNHFFFQSLISGENLKAGYVSALLSGFVVWVQFLFHYHNLITHWTCWDAMHLLKSGLFILMQTKLLTHQSSSRFFG